jgi:putative endonuclease
MFYIYFIYSESSDLYYVGHSDNPWRRLEEHNFSEFLTFTSKHRPWILKAVFECGHSRSEALKVEKFIKKQKSRNLIEAMIADKPLYGILAQLVKVKQLDGTTD